MSILVSSETRLLVQGITGREGEFHTRQMIEYGTNVVAGVTPGRAGTEVAGVPVFDTVRDAVESTGANASNIYVPAPFAPDAILEAADAGLALIICITEGIPTLDMARVDSIISRRGARLIGPNCPGVISPGLAKVGIMPAHIHRPGSVGLVSRSGTLTYEIVNALTQSGFGQSTCVGIGGDPIVGTTFVDVLSLFADDDKPMQSFSLARSAATTRSALPSSSSKGFPNPWSPLSPAGPRRPTNEWATPERLFQAGQAPPPEKSRR